MKLPRLPLALAAAFLALLTLPCAALEWKAKSLTFTTAPFQPTQEVVFEFRNTSDKTVTLLDVQTNCDCLDATVEQKIYAAGTGGSIKAVFKIGERAGLTERWIAVVTDESPEPVRLQVRIEVAEIAEIAPRTVAWRVSEENAEKFIEVKPASGLEIQLSSVQPTNAAFTARLETVELGRHYRIYLKPVTTAHPASAAIRLFGREKSGRDVILSAYANVE